MRASIRVRLFTTLTAVALLAASGLSLYFLSSVEAYGLRRLEERLYSEAKLTASLLGAVYEAAGSTGSPTTVDRTRLATVSRALGEVSAETSSRIRVLDADGKVVADSAGAPASSPDDTNASGSLGARPEIAKALRGVYGAATRRTELDRVALYVAAPIRVNGRIVGVAYASSTTFSVLTLVRDYRLQLLGLVALYLAVTLVLAEVLTRWLVRPLKRLEAGAAELASDHSVRVEPTGPSETRALAVAFNTLAEEIETSLVELHQEERRKSRFVSDVSHELRTPLTAIRGAAETLMEGDVPPLEERRFLSTIVSESDRLARLANDLLTLQRIEGATGEIPLSRVDLRQAAQLAVEALEPLATERGVKVAVEGSSPAVLGDRDRLQQVVANLVDNATRMTPSGGLVVVRLGGTTDEAIVSVLDQGPGIPEGDLKSLFERFYRSQPSRDRGSGGAGLGLSIVRAIVGAPAGRITAANRPDGGAVFTVRLPALKD